MLRKISIAIFLAAMQPATAGIFTNGGDYSWESESAWFIGEAPVPYCVEINGDSPVTKEQAAHEVRRAIDSWKSFFKHRRLDRLVFTALVRQTPTPISLNFVEVPACKEGEAHIRFIFGNRTEEIEKIRETYPHFVGLAYRNGFDHNTLRNGGVVFIDRWLTQDDRRYHMILHELGHVFGFPHDSLPLMIDHAGEFVENPLVAPILGQIEAPTWKYRLDDGDVLDFSFNGEKDGLAVTNRLLSPAKEIFGFDPSGFHQLKLKVEADDEEGPVQLVLSANEYPSGKAVSLRGQFTPRGNYEERRFGQAGPVLTTFFYSRECERTVTGRRRLDTRVLRTELEGAFELGGKTYPAILEAKPGSVLSVYLPGAQRWWTVSDYPAVRIWTKR